MEIHCSQNSVLICEKVKPCKVSVEFLLRENVISEDNFGGIGSKGVTREDILNKLQISEGELDAILQELNPVEINGKFYRIAQAFMLDIGSKILMVVAQNGLN